MKKHMQETRTSKDQILMITQKKEMDRRRSTGISSLAKQSRNQEIRKKPWNLGEALYMGKKDKKKRFGLLDPALFTLLSSLISCWEMSDGQKKPD